MYLSLFLHLRKPNEAFGDYTARLGFPAIKEFQAAYASAAAAAAPAVGTNGAKPAVASVSLNPSTLSALEAAAKAQGKTLDEFLADAAKQLVTK